MEMKKPTVEKLTIVEMGVEKLTPNPWNPNRMSQRMRAKLKAYVKREGLVEPLVVRPKGEGFEILGGFHRWGIAKELGYTTVPCVVVDLDDRRAKILSINLNEMKGQSVPSLLSHLLADLQHVMRLPDLEVTLPYEKTEIQDFLSLMQLPEGLADELEQEAREADENAPVALTLALDKKQAELWDETVEVAKDEVGGAKNPKARTLEVVCAQYLELRKG